MITNQSQCINSNAPSLFIKKLHPNARLPSRQHPTDAGLDLYTIESGKIPANGKSIISTGIAIQMNGLTTNSQTLCMQIISRSGLSAKYSIEKGAGLIDEMYRGEIKIILYNHSNHDYYYKEGERIAQAIIMPVILPEIIEVNELDNTKRGLGGFGSTGL